MGGEDERCVSILLLLYMWLLLLLLLFTEGEDRQERERVQAITRASRMMMEREVVPSVKPESW